MSTHTSSPAHRPSLYQPQFCTLLIAHMARGMSFESFAASIKVGRTTLYDWQAQQPDFAYAHECGKAEYINYWETIALSGFHSLPPSVWRWHMARVSRMYQDDMQEKVKWEVIKAQMLAKAKADLLSELNTTQPTETTPSPQETTPDTTSPIDTPADPLLVTTESMEVAIATSTQAQPITIHDSLHPTPTKQINTVDKFIKHKGKKHHNQQRSHSKFHR